MGPTLKEEELSSRLSTITEAVGFALWQLQELESTSAHYFVLLVEAQKGMGLAAGNLLLEKAQRNTFGKTIKRLSAAGLLHEELEARFVNILAERNWLVHKSRAFSRVAIYDEAAMEKLLFRLGAIASEALDLLKLLAGLIDQYVKYLGVTEQQLEQETGEVLEQWYSSSST
jgi:hypothetical protein